MTVDPPQRYQEWIDFYFGRAFKDPWTLEWSFEADPETKAQLLAATMTRCGGDLAERTDDEVAAGLRALLFGDLSNIPSEVSEASDGAKAALINSLKFLYSDLLAVRSPAVLAHLDEGEDRPLVYVTYMIWDVTPLKAMIGLKDDRSGRSLLIDALSEVLCRRPANPAVIESVLHGFSHLAFSYPKHHQQIVSAIDYFLDNRPIVRPELKQYADAAKKGFLQ